MSQPWFDQDIEVVLKKGAEGVEEFAELWDEIISAQGSQKERLGEELKLCENRKLCITVHGIGLICVFSYCSSLCCACASIVAAPLMYVKVFSDSCDDSRTREPPRDVKVHRHPFQKEGHVQTRFARIQPCLLVGVVVSCTWVWFLF